MASIMLTLYTLPGLPSLIALRPFTVAFGIALYIFNRASESGESLLIASPPVLIVLFLLAAAEWGLDLNIDTREVQRTYSRYISPAVAMAVTAGYIDAESHFILNDTLASTAPMLAQASATGFFDTLVGWVAGFLVAGATWFIAVLRAGVLTTLSEFDEDDNIGLQSLISWSENLFVVVGIIVFIIMPLVSLALAGATVLTLLGIQRYLEHREKKSKIACDHCSSMILPSAVACYACGQTNPQPRAVGVFGQATSKLAPDIDEHRLRLTGRKRCYVCATRLKEKGIRQECPDCHTPTFTDTQHLDRYLSALQKRLPKTLAVSTALSAVPLVGMVPGIIYYRLSLITSMSGYIPRSTGCFTRWGVRMINLTLLAFQWVPVFGAAVLPTMCLVNYFVYQSVLRNERKHLSEQPVSVPTHGQPGASPAPEPVPQTPVPEPVPQTPAPEPVSQTPPVAPTNGSATVVLPETELQRGDSASTQPLYRPPRSPQTRVLPENTGGEQN